MPYKDKGKQVEYKKRWNKVYYQLNRSAEIERVKARKNRNAEWLLEYRSKCFCVLCGENTPACLDFHHRDTDKKERSLSNAVKIWGWGIKRLKKEIEKCIVLCSNCHRKVHAGIIAVNK